MVVSVAIFGRNLKLECPNISSLDKFKITNSGCTVEGLCDNSAIDFHKGCDVPKPNGYVNSQLSDINILSQSTSINAPTHHANVPNLHVVPNHNVHAASSYDIANNSNTLMHNHAISGTAMHDTVA